MNLPYRLLLSMIISIAGIILFSGCSSDFGGRSTETTVSPEFDASTYRRFYIEFGKGAGFLKPDIEAVFVNSGLELTDNSEYASKHDSHDLHVIVTVEKGFLLFPEPSGNPESVYGQPGTGTVEVQDAVTKKQLILCVYTRGFNRDALSGECKEMLLISLSRIFKDQRERNMEKAVTNDKGASNESAIQAQDTMGLQSGGFQGIQEPKNSADNDSNIPALPVQGRRKK